MVTVMVIVMAMRSIVTMILKMIFTNRKSIKFAITTMIMQ